MHPAFGLFNLGRSQWKLLALKHWCSFTLLLWRVSSCHFGELDLVCPVHCWRPNSWLLASCPDFDHGMPSLQYILLSSWVSPFMILPYLKQALLLRNICSRKFRKLADDSHAQFSILTEFLHDSQMCQRKTDQFWGIRLNNHFVCATIRNDSSWRAYKITEDVVTRYNQQNSRKTETADTSQWPHRGTLSDLHNISRPKVLQADSVN